MLSARPMATVSVARRYARALLDVTSESKSADAALTQLATLASTYEQNADFRELVSHPSYTREQRLAVLDALLPKLGITDPAVVNLARLMSERRRFAQTSDVLRSFRELVDARENRIRGTVTSAQPLSEELVGRLQQNLKRMTQREVILDSKVDASLIGGASTQLGSTVFDGSLRTQLEEMRTRLTQA